MSCKLFQTTLRTTMACSEASRLICLAQEHCTYAAQATARRSRARAKSRLTGCGDHARGFPQIRMTRTARVAACQTPDIRGDVDGALAWIAHCAAEAMGQGVELLCFPEGFLQGYETRDREWVRRHALDLDAPVFERLLDRLAGIQPTLVIGLTELDAGRLYNLVVEEIAVRAETCG